MDDKNSDVRDQVSHAATRSKDFTRMAEEYRLQGRYEEAIAVCRKELEKTPDALLGRLILGKCYFEKGRMVEAKQELEKVAGCIEECLSVYKLLSQVYLQENKNDQASEVLRKALYLSPGEAKEKKGFPPPEMALLQQKIKTLSIANEADPYEEKAVNRKAFHEDQSQRVIQTDTLAEIYSKQGHLGKALSIYQEILERQPGNTYIQEKYETLRKQLEAQRKTASKQRVISKLERWLAVAAPGKNPLSP